MISVHIKSFTDDPKFQGVIEPEDGSWKLYLDKQGYPRLVIQVTVQRGDTTHRGYIAVDDVLPEGSSVPQLMQRVIVDEDI